MKPTQLTLVAAFAAALLGGVAHADLLYHYTFDLNGGANDGLQDSGASGSPNPLLLGPAGSIVSDCVRLGDGALFLDTSQATDLTPVTGVTADGGYDGAYSTNAIEVGASATGDLLTIAAWIRASDVGQESSPSIVDFGTNPGSGNRCSFRLDSGTRYLRHEIEGGNTIASGGPVLNDTLWHHVAMVIDPRPRTATLETDDAIQNDVVLYIDGVRYAVDELPPNTLTGNNADTNTTALEFGLSQIRIGDGINDNNRDFSGYIDDVRIYNEPLDDTAIQTLASDSGVIVSCFAADRTSFIIGEIATFEWDAFDFETLTITNDQDATVINAAPLTDPVTGRGSTAFVPVNGTYTLTGTRNGGAEVEARDFSVSVQTAPDVTAAVIPSITDGTAPVEICWQATSIVSSLSGDLEALTSTTATDSDRDFSSLLSTPQGLELTVLSGILKPDPIPVTSFSGSDLTLASSPLDLISHSELDVNREYEADNEAAQIASGLDNTRWADANNPNNTGNNGAAYMRDNTNTIIGRDPVTVNDPNFPLITKAYESGPDIGYASVWEGGLLDPAGDQTIELWFRPNSLVAGPQILLEWGGSGRGSYIAFVDDEIVLQIDADPDGRATLPDTGLGDSPITLSYDIDPAIVTSGTFETEVGVVLVDLETDFDTSLNDPNAIYLLDITSGPAIGTTTEIKSFSGNGLEVRGAGLGAGAADYEIRAAYVPWTQVACRFIVSNDDLANDSAEIFINGESVISLENVLLEDIAGGNGGGIGGQFQSIGQGGPVPDNQANSFFDGLISTVRVHTTAVPDAWILASWLESSGAIPTVDQQAVLDAELANVSYDLNWAIQPDTITINDGSTDVFTTSDPLLIAGGCYDAGVIGTNTTYTVTAAFTGGDSGQSTASLDTTSDGSSYEEIIRADSPLAYYRFEEQAGSIGIFDYSGNHYHSITNVGTPGTGLGSSGVIGNSWIADGTSAWRIPVPLNPQDPDGDDDPNDLDGDGQEGFTLEAIVRPDDADILNNQPIFQQEDLNGTGRSALSLNDLGTLRTFYGGAQTNGEVPLLDEGWCHVAITAFDNGLDYTVRFYVDGQPAQASEFFLLVDPSTGDWRIGVDKNNGDFWVGSIDEMAFYDYPLDDPNYDQDTADSMLPAHAAALTNNTDLGILAFGAIDDVGSNDGVVREGDQVTLKVKVGANATTVEVDNGVGTVVPVNGVATIVLSPPPGTTTYTLTVNGSETSMVNLTTLPPVAISDLGVTGADFFSVTAINLVPGVEYDLFYSPDLETPFVQIFDNQTADDTSELTFEDPVPFDPVSTPKFFYRVEELPPLVP